MVILRTPQADDAPQPREARKIAVSRDQFAAMLDRQRGDVGVVSEPVGTRHPGSVNVARAPRVSGRLSSFSDP